MSIKAHFSLSGWCTQLERKKKNWYYKNSSVSLAGDFAQIFPARSGSCLRRRKSSTIKFNCTDRACDRLFSATTSLYLLSLYVVLWLPSSGWKLNLAQSLITAEAVELSNRRASSITKQLRKRTEGTSR